MANKKTVICKTCGEEIAKSAKACPKCGAKQKRKNVFLYILLIIILLIIIAALSGKGDEPHLASDTPAVPETAPVKDSLATEATPAEEETNPAEVKTSFGVGEKVEFNDIIATLVRLEESSGSDYNYPADGNVFVLCEFEIENNSANDIAVSSLISFEAYCDSYSISESLRALMEKGNKNQLDGQIASGKKMNGVIGYEVPSDWKELEIQFTPDFWRDKEIVFIASK